MNSRRKESCLTAIQSSYPQSLKQAIDRHLPCTLFQAAKGGGWSQRYLVLCVLIMSWSMAGALSDRFDQARKVVVKMFPGRKRPGTTYQGFIAALAKNSEGLLETIAAHLRGEVRTVAGNCWEHRGFVPFGADGSKVECSKTQANELEFGCAGKKKSTPQQFVTTLLHLRTGMVWDFMTGPARSSERSHLRQMLRTLPENSLLVADAGFTGYDLLSEIQAQGHSLLIRVGANVRLLVKLGYAIEERNGTVYLWPDEMQKKNRPPLVLRLITLCDGRNRRMHLLTNVLDESRLTDAAACEFYTMRWGVELYYRALKQTLARRKLASDAPQNARLELRWAMVALWLLCLMAAEAIGRAGNDVRRLSVAGALRLIRKAMDAPIKRSGRGGLGRQLAKALQDDYERTTSKRPRDWAHKKKPKPIGDPKARLAEETEVQQARELREKAMAA
jgi:hypothetical protein